MSMYYNVEFSIQETICPNSAEATAEKCPLMNCEFAVSQDKHFTTFYFIWTEFLKWEILIKLLDEITPLWLLQSGGYQFLSLQAKSSVHSQASSKDVF